MNTMKFDVVALGNHEFDNGVVELARRLGNLKAEVVCANYDFTGTPVEEYVKPYAIVRRGGLKVGIIGLLTDITRVVDMNLVGNLEYQDPAEVVNRYAAYLKNEKGCDLVFCLSHLGFSGDMETAPKIRNVDVIVGGHSHTRLDAMEVVKDLDGKDVMIVQDWCWGMTVGNLKVSY